MIVMYNYWLNLVLCFGTSPTKDFVGLVYLRIGWISRKSIFTCTLKNFGSFIKNMGVYNFYENMKVLNVRKSIKLDKFL